jgi:hypothetical protein
MSDVIECSIGNCSIQYKTIGGLRTHQRKKHEDVYKIKGIQMKKRAKVTEVVINTRATFEAPMIVTLPQKEKEEVPQDFSKFNALERNIAETNKQMMDVQTDFSGLLAQLLELQDHVKLLAKKTTKWCVICFEKENNHAFTPCGHKCVCHECAINSCRTRMICPICRNPVTGIQQIFDISAWDEHME